MKIIKLISVVQFVVMLLISVAVVPARAGSFQDAEAAFSADAVGDYGKAISPSTRDLEAGNF